MPAVRQGERGKGHSLMQEQSARRSIDDLTLAEVEEELKSPKWLLTAFGNEEKAAAEGYYRLELLERWHSSLNLGKHPVPVSLWYRGLTLYLWGHKGDWVIEGDATTLAVRKIQSRLLGLAISSSKAGVDLLLAGYYSIAFAAIRHMLEASIQCIYLSLEPRATPRWQASMTQTTPAFASMVDRIANGGVISKVDAQRLKQFVKILDKGNHPSGIGLIQSGTDGEFRFGPTYEEELYIVGLHSGLNALVILLTVLRALRLQTDDWKTELEQLRLDVADWESKLSSGGTEAGTSPERTSPTDSGMK